MHRANILAWTYAAKGGTANLLTTSCILVICCHASGADAVRVVKHPPTSTRNVSYSGNRKPLIVTPLIELPVGAVQPGGWLRKQIELQASGFHGHLEEVSNFLKKEGNAWLDPQGKGARGWEEVPYWLKGYILTAYLLDDSKMIKEAHTWIEAALKSVQADGWFGPRDAGSTVRSTAQDKIDLWPNMVMLFCLQAYYDRTQDPRVLDLMTKYFRFELAIPDAAFLPPYWQQQRAADNLYSVYWLYNRTGEEWLLDLAAKIHRHTANWTDDVANWHNVNMSQAFGGPATYFMQSKDAKHLRAPYRNYAKIRTMYGQVPGGMFGGDENCRPGYAGPRQAIETCGMVEMMLSHETLVAITGDLLWADRCEDVAFNALPAALLADMRGLRYLTAPNQVVSDRVPKNPGIQNGGPMFLMSPNGHRCCQHNFGHGWPYYATHLWYATADNGLAAVFYSECEINGQVGDGTKVTILQQTKYPFEEDVRFELKMNDRATFPLYLRIPGWCDQPTVRVNGKQVAIAPKRNHFIQIGRTWASGDTVQLHLPMSFRLRTWKSNFDSVSVDRGPLTFSLKIGEKFVRNGGSDKWPDIEIHPTTPWNYGLVLDPQQLDESFQLTKRPWPEANMPFTHEGSPLELKGRGKRIPQWQLDYLGLVGKLQPSPVASSEPTETITLIPMGAARLRISAFPVIGDGANAHRWQEPPQEFQYKPSASHCFEGDTVRALCDRRLPRNSNDHGIPRMTWWNRLGTKQWVQYSFPKPREVRISSVYWFDDTGQGQCRVPQSWQLLYQDSDGIWQPAKNLDEYRVARNNFNKVAIEPVKTSAVRLQVQLQSGFSSGILEWQITPE